MNFWDTVWANVVSGALVAAAVAALGVAVARFVTQRWEDSRAVRARDLAAVEELYGVQRRFFATWKAWDYHRPPDPGRPAHPADADRIAALIDEAADAEGAYESLLIRIAVESKLGPNDECALWCLRFGLKQLRYQIKVGEPLVWWRSNTHGETGLGGFLTYQSFKTLLALVAEILIAPRRNTGVGAWLPTRRRPMAESGWPSFARVTGDSTAFRGASPFKERLAAERDVARGLSDASIAPPTGGELAAADVSKQSAENWEWVVIAEALGDIRAKRDPGAHQTSSAGSQSAADQLHLAHSTQGV